MKEPLLIRLLNKKQAEEVSDQLSNDSHYEAFVVSTHPNNPALCLRSLLSTMNRCNSNQTISLQASGWEGKYHPPIPEALKWIRDTFNIHYSCGIKGKEIDVYGWDYYQKYTTSRGNKMIRGGVNVVPHKSHDDAESDLLDQLLILINSASDD